MRMLTAFASVGVILVGGLSLTSLRDLDVGGNERWLAVVGAGAAILGVVISIRSAFGVFNASTVTLDELAGTDDAFSEVREAVKAAPSLSVGYADDLGLLATEYRETRREMREALAAHHADQGGEAKRTTAERLTRRMKSLDRLTADVLTFASFTRIRLAFENAKRWMTFGAALTAGGVLAYAFMISTGESGRVPVVGDQPIEVVVDVVDKAAVRERLAERVGVDCDLDELSGVALAAHGQVVTVAVVPSPNCSAVLIDFKPTDARVFQSGAS